MALTAAQQAAREGKIGASFIPWLMAGDEAKMLREWRRLVGDPAYEEEDLSGEWVVAFGAFVEPFLLDWHERKTGHALTRRREVVPHPGLQHICCTLDAWREHDNCVVDCKARIAFQKVETILSHYTPQLVVQRACLQADRAALLVMHGGGEPREFPIEWDADYEAAVWDRIAWFWDCVESLRCPVAVEPIIAPVPAVREVDMSQSNAWCVEAAAWLANKAAAKTFDGATKAIKGLIKPDVARAFGAGIVAAKSRNGAITIKEATP